MNDRVFYGWWIVISGCIISLMVRGTIVSGFTAFFDPIAKEFGWSSTQVSTAVSIRGIVLGLLSPVVGFLVGRFGARFMILTGILIIGGGFVYLSGTQSLGMFYGGFAMLAIGMNCCTAIVLLALMASWFRRKISTATGILMSGFGASGLLVWLIAWLIDQYQWRVSFLLLGLAIWLVGIPLSLVIRNSPCMDDRAPDGDFNCTPVSCSHGELARPGVKLLLGRGAFWRIAACEAARMAAVSAVLTHIVPYLTRMGMSRTVSVSIASVLPVLSIAGRVGFGLLGDRVSKRAVLSIALLCLAVGMLSLVGENALSVLGFLLFFPLGHGGTATLRGPILLERFGNPGFSRAIGLVVGIGMAGSAIGPFIAGRALDMTGQYKAAWYVLTLGILLAAAFLLQLPRLQRRPDL